MKPSSSQNSLFITPNSSLIQQDSSSSSPSLLISNPPEERSSQVKWSWEENKVFENALAEFGIDESELLLSTLALRIPTKTTSQFRERLKALEDDINMIESSDFDEILNLLKSDDTDVDSSQAISKNIINEQEAPKKLSEASSRSVPRERRKPIPWTKTEHEMFILGLERYGRGNWKSISRHLVPSKTPAQIASHAQKYFIKLNNPKSRPRKDGSFMRTVDDSQKPPQTAKDEQLAISDDNKKP